MWRVRQAGIWLITLTKGKDPFISDAYLFSIIVVIKLGTCTTTCRLWYHCTNLGLKHVIIVWLCAVLQVYAFVCASILAMQKDKGTFKRRVLILLY